MDDDKLEELERDLMKREIDSGDETICLGVIFVVMLLIAGYGLLTYPEHVAEPVNITAHVIDKQIVYDNGLYVDKNHYFIYTEDYCFDVNLHTYNLLNKGDTVNLTDYCGVTLDIGNYSFMAE